MQLEQLNRIRAVGRYHTAAHFAFAPFELGFVVWTQLIVLSRFQHFVIQSSQKKAAKKWKKARVCFLIVIVCLMVLGICANLAAAFYYSQASVSSNDAADAYADNKTATGAQLRSLGNTRHSLAGSIASIQRFSEVASLLLIILAFLIAGSFGFKAVSSVLRSVSAAKHKINERVGDVSSAENSQLVADASLQGHQLNVKLLVTTVFMFVSLLLRSIYSIFYAVAQSLQNNGDPCAVSWCDPCKNVYSNIHGWLLYALSLPPTHQPFIRSHLILFIRIDLILFIRIDLILFISALI